MPDREQTRRDAEPIEMRKLAHQAVTEGVNLKYVERMRQALYKAADALEQAERQLAAAPLPLAAFEEPGVQS